MKRINKKFIIFILILFISIGFAYLSATLNIAGLIGYKGNSWNIYFDNVQMIKNDVSADKPIINNSKDSVDFNISFSEPGEIYKFSVDVVNDGTIDAMIGEFIKTGIDSTNEDYIDYSVKYSNGEEVNVNDLLMHNTKVRLIVNVEYKYTTDRLAPENTSSYSLTIKYVQANDNARKVEELVESGNNNTFVLNNAKANSLSNLKIYGNTSQTQYSGKNLYNVSDYCLDDVCIGSGTTVDEDGWIKITMDNTNGTRTVYSNYFTNNLDLVVGDTYTIVVEVKSVTGTGGLYYTSVLEQGTSNGQLGNHSFNLDKVKAGDIIIVSDVAVESGKWGLRTFGAWNVGESGSITFRLSVIKGTGVTKDNFVYEPYVGGIPSPNPDYPQDIHSVTDGVQIHFSLIKNVFNKNNIRKDYQLAGGYGVEAARAGWFVSDFLSIKPQTEYQMYGKSGQYNCFYKDDKTFISCNQLSTGVITTPENAYYMKINDSLTNINKIYIFESAAFNGLIDKNIYSADNYLANQELLSGVASPRTNWFVSDFIKVEGLTSYYILNKTTGTQNAFYDSDYNYITTISRTSGVVEAPEGAKYMRINGELSDLNNIKIVPYLYKINITLGALQLNKIADYKDYIYNRDGEWYIHKEIGNSTVTSLTRNTTSNSNYNRWYKALPGADQIDKNLHNKNGALCNIACLIGSGSTYNLYDGFTVTANKEIILYFDKWKEKTTQEINDWLAENNVYSYYKLLNYTDEKITDTTLINQLNNLLNNNLFEGTNYVTVIGSDLAPTIEFDYEK